MKEEPEAIFHYVAKARAKKQGLPFTITVEDVKAVWPKDGKCPVLGIPLFTNKGKVPGPNSPSLDRVIPDLGYVKGNIAVISMKANLIKQDETDPQVFRRIATWLQRFLNVKGQEKKKGEHSE
jgi:hypothetical protein